MPILSMSAGRVTAIWGAAFYIHADGSLHPVRVGDELIGGQQVLTDQNGIVEIEPKALSPKILQLIQAMADADHGLKSPDASLLEVAPAAGLDGGGSGSLQPATRVERVVEGVSPWSMSLAAEGAEHPPVHALGAVLEPLNPGWLLASTTPSTELAAPTPEVPLPAQVPPGESPMPLVLLTVAEHDLRAGAVTQTTTLDRTTIADAGELALQAPSAPVYTTAGQAVVWLSDGHGGLIGKLADAPLAPDVARLTLDAHSGAVQVTWSAPMQHAAQGADDLLLTFGVRASGQSQDVAQVLVTVHDDVPVAHDAHVAAGVQGTNLMVVLDVSADMAQSMEGPSRLQASLQALDALVDRYAHEGPLAVRLVLVSDQAQALGDSWVSATTAKNWLNGLLPHGEHDYAGALPVAQEAFLTEAGRLPGAQNVSYFFAGGSAGTHGVDAAEQSAWERFLTDHQIDSQVIGVGTQVTHADLDGMAYDGLLGADHDAWLVPHRSELQHLPALHAEPVVQGSLLDGADFGADGFGRMLSVSSGGHDHPVDLTLPLMTFTTGLGGALTLDALTGHYRYVAPAGWQGAAQDSITYTATDGDEDRVSNTVMLDLRDLLQSDQGGIVGLGQPAAPQAVADVHAPAHAQALIMSSLDLQVRLPHVTDELATGVRF